MAEETISTVLAAAADYDLTDLTTVKDELSIKTTADDLWLQRAITQVSSAIANYCNRIFQVEAVQDVIYVSRAFPYRMISGVQSLQLSRYPVAAVSAVVQTLSADQSRTLVPGTDYQVDARNGALVRLQSNTGFATTWEALPIIIIYTAGYGAISKQSATVPATGFTVTVDEADTFSIDQGVAYASGVALTKVVSNPAVGQYIVDANTGIYTFAAADALANVDISYGYNAIPDDLVDAALRLVTQRFKGRGRDPLQMSINQPGTGEQRFWVGAAPGQNGAFPPEIQGLLDNYRAPVLA